MSHIDALIREFCPRGVRHVTLAEVAKTVAGLGGKTKADFADGNSRYVSYKNVYANMSVDQQAPAFVTLATDERQNRLQKGDVLITGSSENFEDVGLSSVVLSEPVEPLYLNSFCFAVRLIDPDLLLPRFSMYLFRSEPVRTQIRRAASGVTRINISKARFMKLRIPVPPVEVQREIVRVLDSFQALDTELKSELAARQRQSSAYHNRLAQTGHIRALCGDDVEEVALGSICSQYVEPVRVQPEETYTNLGVKWYGEGAFAREPKLGSEIKGTTLYRVKPRQFIYNRMFVTEGSFGLVTPDLAHGVVSNEFPVFDLDESRVLAEWLYLRFRDPATLGAVAAQATGGTKSRRRWREDQFAAFVVELPPLRAQREIVRIMSTFSKLEDELEGELFARRKQYGHYRDRLLTFQEATA